MIRLLSLIGRMNLVGRLKLRAAYVMVAATVACSGEDPTDVDVPEPGFVNMTLSALNVDDGAIMFQLSGAAIDSIASPGASFLAAAETGTNTHRVIVAGRIVNGVVARFWIPDRRNIASYTAVVEQAAAASTYEQRDVTGYSLSLAP